MSAAMAAPIEAIAAQLPASWRLSPIRWFSSHDIRYDLWVVRADIFIGKCVDETPEKISLENPVQLMYAFQSTTKDGAEHERVLAARMLRDEALRTLAEMNAK